MQLRYMITFTIDEVSSGGSDIDAMQFWCEDISENIEEPDDPEGIGPHDEGG